jgi:hypothetical protein
MPSQLLSSDRHICNEGPAMRHAEQKKSPAISCPAARRAGWGIAAILAYLASPTALPARDSLGIYDSWGAFRDPLAPRCYAIAMAEPSRLKRDYQPYATVGTWPKRRLRNQVHFRLSRKMADKPRISLSIGGKRFALTGGGGDAWPADKPMNAQIIAAMRSENSMTVSAADASGTRFSNSWQLQGAASAMDAATVGCSKLR